MVPDETLGFLKIAAVKKRSTFGGWLERGDVILGVDGIKTSSAKSLRDACSGVPGSFKSVIFRRGDRNRKLTFQIPEVDPTPRPTTEPSSNMQDAGHLDSGDVGKQALSILGTGKNLDPNQSLFKTGASFNAIRGGRVTGRAASQPGVATPLQTGMQGQVYLQRGVQSRMPLVSGGNSRLVAPSAYTSSSTSIPIPGRNASHLSQSKQQQRQIVMHGANYAQDSGKSGTLAASRLLLPASASVKEVMM